MKKIIALIFVLSLVFSPGFIFAQSDKYPVGAMENSQARANKIAGANVKKERKRIQREEKKKQREARKAQKLAQKKERQRQKAMEQTMDKYKK